MNTEKRTNSKLERGMAGAALLAIFAGSAWVALINPTSVQLLPPCPLLSITGFACPGCGLTRAFHALFQGDVLTALDFNALTPFYVIGILYLLITLGLIFLRGRGLPLKTISPVALIGFLIVSIVFGVVRNIPAEPFTVLFP